MLVSLFLSYKDGNQGLPLKFLFFIIESLKQPSASTKPAIQSPDVVPLLEVVVKFLPLFKVEIICLFIWLERILI
jgi:hypothetical protein